MHIVFIWIYLHEILNPIFWREYEKYHQFVVCWISQESGKG